MLCQIICLIPGFLRGYPGIKQVIWQSKGHYDHVHGATTMHTGGIVPGALGRDVNLTAQGGEGVFTREQMAALGALGGPRTVRAEVPVYLDGKEIAREVREVLLFAQQDMVAGGLWSRQ